MQRIMMLALKDVLRQHKLFVMPMPHATCSHYMLINLIRRSQGFVCCGLSAGLTQPPKVSACYRTSMTSCAQRSLRAGSAGSTFMDFRAPYIFKS